MNDICNRQASTSIILTLAVVSLGWYLVLLLNPLNIDHPVAYALLVVAELIGMAQLLGTWLTVIVGKPERPSARVLQAREALAKHPGLAGKVAVFVPVAGESLEIVAETLRAARDIAFPHVTYVLDDGKSDEVRALAKSLGIGYSRRSDRTGWKAGNINHALRHIPCDYFVIFDSDFVAKPEFLIETLPHLIADDRVAFVQTPQHFKNTDSFIGGGAAETQEVFYKHIQTAKNHFNSAFCVGTNVVFRAKAVRELGGMYDKSHSEDIWTALLLHERGWKSVYIPKVLATGLAPETVDGYFRQQFRWAGGGYEIFFWHNPLFRRSLSLDQKLQYFHTVLFFLSGFSVCIFYLLPLLYVYFGWKPLALEHGVSTWIRHFIPYLVFMYASIAHLIGHFPRWRTFVVALGAFPAHMCACLAALTGMRIRWSASGVIRRNIDYVKAVMLHLLMLFFSVVAIPVVLTSEYNGPLAIQMSLWLLWNSALLFSFCRRAIPWLSPQQAAMPRPAFAEATAGRPAFAEAPSFALRASEGRPVGGPAYAPVVSPA